MDDGEVELCDQVLLSNPDVSCDLQGPTYDSFDEFLKNTRTCTHTHTCNPPGPDAAHTHTCYHTHTQVLASEDDEGSNDKEKSVSKSRRPSGNREAVRKYREKKKAHTAYLEEEVKKLRILNQQLVRRLQGQSILEAEVLRLRTLLTDLRGKIDSELDVKRGSSTVCFKEGDGVVHSNGGIDIRCNTDVPCLHPQAVPSLQAQIGGRKNMMSTWEGSCQPAIMESQAYPSAPVGQNMASVEGHTEKLNPETMDTLETLVSSASQPEQQEGRI
ncbi:basic leucine zipper 23-like [Macadamia integrifolia]|uniref:basic leucine zipper 23-like n=1 Tax=Macadamia integrifolia TaxID=60698 RepID=UPI001C4E3EEA|nr:basic leucine zipper 23-like [Macadamia integrifolia]XP_042496882.1 basic leucine zipper 23-like [Macadamia integrifolia]XP_042496891.1 basic leucine zipper 23-like [Macadamia integrifolia]XP_042496898.1 basic leucine zipper 23-like [Macadamia integrifolia]